MTSRAFEAGRPVLGARPWPEGGSEVVLPAGPCIESRVADLLLETTELLMLVEGDPTRRLQWVEPHLQSVLDALCDVVSRLAD